MMAEGDETLTDPLSQDNLDKLDRLHLEVSSRHFLMEPMGSLGLTLVK